MIRLFWMTALVLAAAFGATEGHAYAQDDANRARLHFQAGASYYEAGDYEDALREFQRSYDLSQRPELFYNFSLCHQQLGRLDEAIVYLDRYLREVEEVPNRANLERRLTNFRTQQANEARAAEEERQRAAQQRRAEAEAAAAGGDAEEPEPAAPDSNEDEGGANGAAIGSFVVAGAGVVVLGVAGGLALAQRSDLDDQGCAPNCDSGDVSTLRTRAIVADIGLAVALVGATLGVVFLLTGGEEDDESEQASWGVSPWVGPRSGGAAVAGRF